MVKKLLYLVALMALLPAMASGQTYSALWKQADEAKAKDLPQSQIKVLTTIVEKADAEGNCGQLLKAGMAVVNVATTLAPDSLPTAIGYITRRMDKTTDPALHAVYAAALCRMYRDNPDVADNAAAMADSMRMVAMANPEALAQARAADYDPFIVRGYDSRVFGHDLLSVIGYEVEDYKTLYEYYSANGQRAAACMSALGMVKQHRELNAVRISKSDYIMWLDSLISVYSDLDVTAEAAIERYNYMEAYTDATVEERISYIHYVLDKWGGWHSVGQLRNAEKNLTSPCFAVSMERKVVEPGTTQTIRLGQLRNISALTMRLYRANTDATTTHDPRTDEGFRRMQPMLTLLREQGVTRRYMSHPDYQYFEDSLTIGPLEPGVYVMELRTSPSTEVVRCMFYVTSLRLLALPLPGDQVRYVAVNATTGQPVPGATVTLRQMQGRKATAVATLTCDAHGEALHRHTGKGRLMAMVSTADDRYCPADDMYGSFAYSTSHATQTQVRAFTDRHVYRPGQTVRLAAVAYEQGEGGDLRAVAGQTIKATLLDANFKTVAERDLTTDDYGTCAADFALPTGAMTGHYHLRVGSTMAYFMVEEYKRPTFQVELPKVNERYADGDTLVVRGRATTFAGAPVQGASYKYTVRRSPATWWRGWGDHVADGHAVMWRGEGTTGADGSLAIELPMVLPTLPAGVRRFYNFTATVDVTDAAGETRTGELSVPLGTRATAFGCDLPSQALADSLSHITFTLRNASGECIGAEVRCRIDGQGEWLHGYTDKPLAIGRRLASGRHSLMAVCESDTLRAAFTVFGLDDTVPSTPTHSWFYVSAESFPVDGSPVTVQVGSSDSLVHILYSVIAGDKVIESGALDLSNALHNRKLTYTDDYADGICINYAWVKHGQCHRHSAIISRPRPSTRLNMQWETFRDRLTPGQQEEWTLRVTMPDGRPAQAQLMATLYDKALDEIGSLSWSFAPSSRLSLPHTSWQVQQWGGVYGGGMRQWTSLAYRPFEVSHFDNEVMPQAITSLSYSAFGRPRRMLVRGTRTTKSMAMANAQMVEEAATADFAASLKAVAVSVDQLAEAEAGGQGATGHAAALQLRENFQETAFFYPALTTDTAGLVTIKFTLPESLTTWRMMGMAHTRDMHTGIITGEAVASKAVMVVPNVPRFVRTGDHTTIAARIVNTSGKDVSGTARLELIDPDTEKTVLSRSSRFGLKADSTASVAFAIDPPADYSLLICRVSASGATFSDGEQHYLPVLPSEERVCTTAPFMLRGASTASVDLQSMLPGTASQSKLTIEYTNNPAWLAVQALPTVGTASSENAIDQCAAYYANAVGHAIAHATPAVQTAVERWQMERGEEQSLESSLAKNEQLRDIVLAETPWVADADREEEQKRRLADFFDDNLMQSRRDQAAARLAALQCEDGSWSWYPGMEGSMNITVEVAEMMVRANHMAGHQEALDQMLDKAFDYMGQTVVKQVAAMRKAERQGAKPSFPGTTTLRYLYLCAIDGRRLPTAVRQANDYLVDLLQQTIGQQTIYEKALTTVVLDKRGLVAKSREYAQSLREYTVWSDNMGRYYDTPRAAYSWRDYAMPTHVAAMEALARVAPGDTATIGEMRLWLMRQKQAQAWDTPINSVNAIYALVYGNTDVLASRPMATIAIDGRELALPEATAALGYVKTSVTEPQGRTLTATKATDGTSWGAVYAQGMVPLADIEAAGAGISVERHIIKPSRELRVGDRVTVRITITAERDLDFVQVVDRRAACMEPVVQTSGYRGGAYCSPKDNATTYCFDRMAKGKHVVETEYYIDRQGHYHTGTCTAACAYATEYRATAKPMEVVVE